MTWNPIDLAGKTADVFDPPDPLPFALIFLHDESGALPDALAAELRARRLRCVAPRGGRSWWVDRVCPEFDSRLTSERHVLDHILPWSESEWNLGPRAVAAAGVGMGGQGAVRLGFRHPARFPVVASIAGAFDFHDRYGAGTPLDDMYASREQARQDTAVLQIHGHDWPPHVWFACPPSSAWHRGNDRLREKLTALGVPHTADLETRADAAGLIGPMLAFVAGALARESRRLA